MLRYANRFNIKVIGVASKKDSILLKASDIKILLPQVKEADPFTKMVPTTSTSITLLLGDCLSVALMSKMNFSKDRFKIFHPGGNIGQTLLLVKDIMIKQTIQSAQNQAGGTGVQQTQDMTSIVSDIIVNTNTETGSKMIEEVNNSSTDTENNLSLQVISAISEKDRPIK